jgi:uncharacterized protein
MTKAQSAIIASVSSVLKKTYGEDTTGHDWFHLDRVWKMAKRLAKDEQVDDFVVEMAALLHDVDDYKFKKEGEDELSGTTKILEDTGVGGNDREHILAIIRNVSFKGSATKTKQFSHEGSIVQDADRLDALGALGIARSFTYNGYKRNMMHDPSVKPRVHVTFAEYKKQSTAINHFYEKLLLLFDRLNTAKARDIGKHRHSFLQSFLDEFLAEWEGKR